MYQYYITEVRKLQNGEFEHYNYWQYDEDDQKARLKGESKYHEILSQAAVSEYPEHGCILFTSTCYPIMNHYYTHIEEAAE